MTAREGYWDSWSGAVGFPVDRYLEYTKSELKIKYLVHTHDILDELIKYPTLFAYEFHLKAPARVGHIWRVERALANFLVSFKLDQSIEPIPIDKLKVITAELDIEPKMEIHRTHWALKDVDLFRVLFKEGLLGAASNVGKEGQAKENFRGNKVFLVHGRDDGAKAIVSNFLKRLDLEVIILHERPNKGRTLISKFEQESADVSFAIVLMTPDDRGGLAGEKSRGKPRARQNVVFEHGFFLGKLGAETVCALVAPGVERPSDFEGVVYIEFGNGTNWEVQLARELRAAGMPVDLNKLA